MFNQFSALIMIDLQNDFCEGGALAVPNANHLITHANKLQSYFSCIIATQDWHPQNHVSFASNHPNHCIGDIILVNQHSQYLWPIHCVQHTQGAAFHPMLLTQRINKIIYKGTETSIDSYSAFFDNAHLYETELADYLKQQHIQRLYMMGLAFDYCVKYSALDAISLGFETIVITDACKSVFNTPERIEQTFNEMREHDVKLITTAQLSRVIV